MPRVGASMQAHEGVPPVHASQYAAAPAACHLDTLSSHLTLLERMPAKSANKMTRNGKRSCAGATMTFLASYERGCGEDWKQQMEQNKERDMDTGFIVVVLVVVFSEQPSARF